MWIYKEKEEEIDYRCYQEKEKVQFHRNEVAQDYKRGDILLPLKVQEDVHILKKKCFPSLTELRLY